MHPLATNNLAMVKTCRHGVVPVRQCRQTPTPPKHTSMHTRVAVPHIPASAARRRQRALQHLACFAQRSSSSVYMMNLLQAPTSIALIRCLQCSIAQHIHGTLDHAMLYFPRRALQPPQQAYISVCCESKHVNIHNISLSAPRPHHHTAGSMSILATIRHSHDCCHSPACRRVLAQ
jgi:hypothetical protein